MEMNTIITVRSKLTNVGEMLSKSSGSPAEIWDVLQEIDDLLTAEASRKLNHAGAAKVIADYQNGLLNLAQVCFRIHAMVEAQK